MTKAIGRRGRGFGNVPLRSATVCWTPHTNYVEVIAWPDKNGHSHHYHRSDGAGFGYFQSYIPCIQFAWLLAIYVGMTARDGIPPDVAARALAVIPEFCAAMEPDLKEALFPDRPTELQWL